MNEKWILYVLQGNDECYETKKLLKEKDVAIDIVDVRERGWMPYLTYNTGIEKLPALITSFGIYEGYKDIEKLLINVKV